MTSNSKAKLNEAIAAMESAYARLSSATALAVAERASIAAEKEEITAAWQAHSAALEAALQKATTENDFLKQDNLRLSKQAQQLHNDYAALQHTSNNAIARLDTTVRQIDLMLEN